MHIKGEYNSSHNLRENLQFAFNNRRSVLNCISDFKFLAHITVMQRENTGYTGYLYVNIHINMYIYNDLMNVIGCHQLGEKESPVHTAPSGSSILSGLE